MSPELPATTGFARDFDRCQTQAVRRKCRSYRGALDAGPGSQVFAAVDRKTRLCALHRHSAAPAVSRWPPQRCQARTQVAAPIRNSNTLLISNPALRPAKLPTKPSRRRSRKQRQPLTAWSRAGSGGAQSGLDVSTPSAPRGSQSERSPAVRIESPAVKTSAGGLIETLAPTEKLDRLDVNEITNRPERGQQSQSSACHRKYRGLS